MSKKRSGVSQLGSAPLRKLLFSMSLQTTLSIALYSLYSIVDTIYIARGVGADAVGAVSISFPLSIILSAVSTTVGSGSASVISRALGKNDIDRAGNAAANSFLIFWSIAIFITVSGLMFLEPLLTIFGVTENLMPYAKEYMSVILIGSIVSTGFSSIIRAEGNTKFSMYIWIIPTVINIILDPIFIFVLKTGVRGAAIATVISQFIAASMSIYFFFLSNKSILKIRLKSFKLNYKIVKEIIAIGIPSFVQRSSISISMIYVNNFLGFYGGDLAISAYGIVNRLAAFMVIPQQGVVQALKPIIGYNFGAKKNDRVIESLKISSITAGIYGLIVFFLVKSFPEFFIGIFSTDPDLITLGIIILQYIIITFPINGIQSIQSAYFQSLGRISLSLFLSLLSNILILIPALFIMSKIFGLTGIWLSFPLSAVISLFISTILIMKDINKLNHRISYHET